MNTRWSWLLLALLPALFVVVVSAPAADDIDKRVLDMEKQRIAAIEKVQPSVVAVLTGGGSGVLISEDGYALTNFHVTSAARGPVMKCGLPDGVLYDAVLVGLDKVGDVALIKLLPKKPGDKFPYAKMGDSDKVQAGDWSLAMGNPFLLATDFTPTVTYGLVSGVHRYQYPSGTLLEYTDCIQIETSINPGNSGGPLFNMEGELIGINGRGSFEKRGRVNSGVGYAISINQIKNFLPQLKAGMDTDHASLGALIESDSEEGSLNKMNIRQVIPTCDAARRGLDVDDQLVEFAGRRILSVNQFKNVLGLYPKGWRVPVLFRHENDKKQLEKRETLVRLMGVQRQELPGQNGQPQPQPQPGPRPRPQPGQRPPQPAPNSPATKLFEAKAGFANYYFNKLEQERLLKAFHKHGDFSKATGDWGIRTTGMLYAGAGPRGKRAVAEFRIQSKGARDKQNDLIQAIVDGLDFSLEPLNDEEKPATRRDPPDSGGLLMALYQYRQMLVVGPKGFATGFSHGGIEPFYPPKEGETKMDYNKLRVDAEVIRTRHAGTDGKWYFSTKDDGTAGQMLGFEVWLDRDEDPCEVYLFDYKDVDGGKLPHRILIRFGDKNYADLVVNSWKKEEGK
ncbi:MAG TPA: trypsin-like peptidase domain-containing protein [Gemmataceae bacterium]|jgi:S1-C subfamily serine protease